MVKHMKTILLKIAAGGTGWQEDMVLVTITGCVWFCWVLLVIGGTLFINWVRMSWNSKRRVV